jgi:hypothetical protein
MQPASLTETRVCRSGSGPRWLDFCRPTARPRPARRCARIACSETPSPAFRCDACSNAWPPSMAVRGHQFGHHAGGGNRQRLALVIAIGRAVPAGPHDPRGGDAAGAHPHGGLRGWVSQGSVVLRSRLANTGDFQGKADLRGRLAESLGDSKGLIVTLGHVLRRVHHRCAGLGRSNQRGAAELPTA